MLHLLFELALAAGVGAVELLMVVPLRFEGDFRQLLCDLLVAQ